MQIWIIFILFCAYADDEYRDNEDVNELTLHAGEDACEALCHPKENHAYVGDVRHEYDDDYETMPHECEYVHDFLSDVSKRQRPLTWLQSKTKSMLVRGKK